MRNRQDTTRQFASGQAGPVSIVTPPSGSEPGIVVRDIFRKNSFIETSTPLGVSATYTGPWHDTLPTGTVWVDVGALANTWGASGATITIQVTEDPATIAGITVAQRTPTANNFQASRVWATIRNRYYRVVLLNGATAQASLECIVTESSLPLPINRSIDALSGNPQNPSWYFINANGGSVGNDNFTTVSYLANADNSSTPLLVADQVYGGAFSGTPQATLQGYSRMRTPTVFRQASTAAAGNTAIWTPGANNKFRLLKYLISLSGNASLAVAGILTVSLFDGAAGNTAQNHQFFVPAAAGAVLTVDAMPFIDLGNFGVPSAAANNVLNVNLSVALVTGLCNVLVMGTEE